MEKSLDKINENDSLHDKKSEAKENVSLDGSDGEPDTSSMLNVSTYDFFFLT